MVEFRLEGEVVVVFLHELMTLPGARGAWRQAWS